MVEFDSFSILNIFINHWGKMLLVSIIVYLFFSLFIYPRIFEKATFSKILLVSFLTVFSINILVSEILSLLNLLNRPWIYLGTQTIFCLIVVLLVHHFFPISKQTYKSFYHFNFFRVNLIDIVLITLISATFIGFFAVGITTPINNIDSLATHLPRIYYWLQHGSLDYWTTINQFQLVYPINAHIQGLWLFLFGRSEYLFFLVQWFSLIIISASAYEISKTLHYSNTQALLSTLIGLSFPIVLLQTFSFQGDLTVTAFAMIFIVFILWFNRTDQMKYLWLAIFSIILAIGTKQTAYITLPMSFCVIIYLLIKKRLVKRFFRNSWLVIVFVIAFASFQFLQNVYHTNTLIGMEWKPSKQYTTFDQFQQKTVYVIPRYFYQFVGIEGLPRSITPTLIQIKEDVFRAMLNPRGLDLEREIFLQPGFDQKETFHYDTYPLLSEDMAWFGPMAILLIPIAVIITFFSKDKLRRKYVLFGIIYSLFYFCLIFIQRPGWDPYQGRYFILGLYPLVPIVSILIPKQRILRVIVYSVLISCSVLLIFNTLLKNDTKPIITAKSKNNFIHQKIDPLQESTTFQVFIKKALYKITYPTGFESLRRNIYSQKYYDQLFYTNNISAKDIEFVNSIIPEGEPISVMVANNPLEYALFGINRSRSLYSFTDTNDARQGYCIVSNSIGISPSHEMELLDVNGNFSIYYIGPK
jgi:hypothetical protein